jgi:hypothetical protein
VGGSEDAGAATEGVGAGGGKLGGTGGAVVQPATSTITAAQTPRARHGRRRSFAVMTWFLLEALLALVLAVGIVWWTMGPRKKKPPDDERKVR